MTFDVGAAKRLALETPEHQGIDSADLLAACEEIERLRAALWKIGAIKPSIYKSDAEWLDRALQIARLALEPR